MHLNFKYISATSKEEYMKNIDVFLDEESNQSIIFEIFTDSAYVFNAFSQNWIENWQKNGWKNSTKKQVANIDLWQQLIDLTKTHNIHFNKVKGHADNELNNLCDKLATSEIAKNKDNS